MSAVGFYVTPHTSLNITKFQRSLRVPFHLMTEVFGVLVFVGCLTTPEAGMCSPFFSEYAALEALFAHMLWPMAYSLLAAIPLATALPFQMFVLGAYMSHNSTLCMNGYVTCPRSDVQYSMLTNITQKIGGSILPFAAPSIIKNPGDANCLNILALIQVSSFTQMPVPCRFPSFPNFKTITIFTILYQVIGGI